MGFNGELASSHSLGDYGEVEQGLTGPLAVIDKELNFISHSESLSNYVLNHQKKNAVGEQS